MKPTRRQMEYWEGDRLDRAARRIPNQRVRRAVHNFGRDDSWSGAAKGAGVSIFGPLVFFFVVGGAIALLTGQFPSKDLPPEQQAAQAERAQHRAAGEIPCGPAGAHKWCKPQALQRPPQRSQQRTDVDADYPADDGERSNQPTAPTSTKRRTVW